MMIFSARVVHKRKTVLIYDLISKILFLIIQQTHQVEVRSIFKIIQLENNTSKVITVWFEVPATFITTSFASFIHLNAWIVQSHFTTHPPLSHRSCLQSARSLRREWLAHSGAGCCAVENRAEILRGDNSLQFTIRDELLVLIFFERIFAFVRTQHIEYTVSYPLESAMVEKIHFKQIFCRTFAGYSFFLLFLITSFRFEFTGYAQNT